MISFGKTEVKDVRYCDSAGTVRPVRSVVRDGTDIWSAEEPVVDVSVTLKGGVKKLVPWPDGLESLTIGTLTSIDPEVTRESLVTVDSYPDSVVTLPNSAFAECSSLETFSLSPHLRTVGDLVFKGTGIERVLVPSSVDSIGDHAFYSCPTLQLIEVSTDNATYASVEGVLYSKDLSVLLRCPEGRVGPVIPDPSAGTYPSVALDCVRIPSDKVKEIGAFAFLSCSGIRSASGYHGPAVEIPSSVESIGSHAFDGCSSMDSVVVGGGVTSVDNHTYAFSGCTSLRSVKFPQTVYDPSQEDTYELCACEFFSDSARTIELVEFQGTASAIADGSCKGMTALRRVVVPASVTDMGYATFEGCSSLLDVNIPDGVTVLKSNLFSGCTSLPSVTIPDSVTSVTDAVFSGCTSLSSVTVPPGAVVSYSPFTGCSGLTSVSVPLGGVPGTLNQVFPASYSKLTSVEFTGSGTTMRQYMMEGCSSVESIALSASLSGVSGWSLQEELVSCENLRSVTVERGNDVYYSQDGALYVYEGASGGKSLCFLPPKWKDVHGSSVYSVPSDVTGIEDYAAAYSEITGVVLGQHLVSVGSGAFYHCAELSSVDLTGCSASIGSMAFEGCSGLISVHIPLSVTSIGREAFWDTMSGFTLIFDGRTQGDVDSMRDRYWGLDVSQCVPGIAPKEFDGLRMKAVGGRVAVQLAMSGAASFSSTPQLEMSVNNGRTWVKSQSSSGTFSVPLTDGQVLFIRAPEGVTNGAFSSLGESTTEADPYRCFKFLTSDGGHVEASGDIRSLINQDVESVTSLPDDCFRRLFYQATLLRTAPDIPAEPVGARCCLEMFDGCTALESAPRLWTGTSVGRQSCQSMFLGCTSLATAPELPAKTLEVGCYSSMFEGCSALKIGADAGVGTKVLDFSDISSIPQISVTNMFRYTGGTFTGDPVSGHTYWNYQ